MDQTQKTLKRFTDDIRRILQRDLHEVIIHGSYVLGDFKPGHGDIDFVVLTRNNLDEASGERLIELHQGYRNSTSLLLHQLEGCYYPKQFLRNLTGEFLGCYIGTSSIRMITTLQNSLMDLHLMNRRGLKLLERSCIIYDPGYAELVSQQMRDCLAFSRSLPRMKSSEMGFWVSLVHWCARTLFFQANGEVASKTEACRWCIEKTDLLEFKDIFQWAEPLRYPYLQAEMNDHVIESGRKLLDIVENRTASEMNEID